VNNDLAILRVHDPAKIAGKCTPMPFKLVKSGDVKLGESISTIGYPLSTLLGSSPKFSEGVIAAKSGLQDDPRWFQISADIQPGSSGSPLFDANGNVIGIVVASLDAAKAFQLTNSFPQNVNWAIKSDYLLSLLEMIPDAKIPDRTGTFSPESASACIALVNTW
jgi:S1-C subfamily serine protease